MGILRPGLAEQLEGVLREERTQRVKAESEAAGLRDRVISLERQVDYLQQALERDRILFQRVSESRENLVDKIVELKREGFTPAPFADPGNLEKLDLDLPQDVMDAIQERSHRGSELEARLTRWALAAMRVKGATPEDVAQKILDGASPPAVEEEVD